MREIKFRAWITKTIAGIVKSKMVDVFSIFGLTGGGLIIEADGKTFKDDEYNFTLMQFTGLHDKNGKEIYEADILLHITTGERGVIKYAEGAFYCDHQNLSSYSLPNINNCKVIGNIHENPELLGK